MSKLIVLILTLVIVPLSILGYLAISDAQTMGLGASDKAQMIGNNTLTKSTDTITDLVGESLVRLGQVLAGDVVTFLEERESDTLALAELASGDIQRTSSNFMSFNAKLGDIWYNVGTDLSTIEKKERIPIYSEISFIGTDGIELVRLVDGQPAPLRDVSDPLNTEFKSEDYFSQALGLLEGEIYVSRVNTWYLPTSEARKDLPDETRDGKMWNILPGRDTMKSGNIRFATPVYEDGQKIGVVVLSVDYRHIQELTKHIDPVVENRVVSTPYEGNYILFFDDQGFTIVHPKPNNIRGYLEDGTLEHTNTVETPGGIFNLRDYDKNDAYKSIYAAIINKESLVRSAVDVKGRRKMTVSVPVIYDSGVYKDAGIFGGLMLSVNTDKFYESVISTEEFINKEIQIVKHDIVSSTESTKFKMIIVTLITIVVGIVIGIIFSRGIVNPLRKLTIAGARVADGNLDTEIPDVKSKDEIEELRNTMSLLIGAIKFFKRNKK